MFYLNFFLVWKVTYIVGIKYTYKLIYFKGCFLVIVKVGREDFILYCLGGLGVFEGYCDGV